MAILSILALAAGSASTAFADNPSGCDFAATGTTESCSPPLAGSTFAGGDGNLLASPSTFGSTDWQNVAGLNHGIDLPSGTSDNSFGQGTKEDSPNVTVVTGSIPNQKSDLTRFYEASEIGSNTDNFLYLAWERANSLGTANLDFEINQSATAGFTTSTTGPVTLNRTAGDLLVTFDFTNGGGKPTLGLLTWLTAAAGNTASQCFSGSTLPCWGNQETLNGTDSIGAVNNLDPVTDPLFPTEANYQNPVPALQFGETAIDLTKAGVFPAGTCKAFGSAFVKSRSSASFTAEVKDFIAPIPVNIANCGTITVHKITIPAGGTGFSYTTTGGAPLGGSFSLNDGDTKTFKDVPIGGYSVTESPKTGWDFVSLTCTATGSGTGDSISGETASITISALGEVDCTYTNHIHASPTIATTLSATTVNTGTAVHDSATLSGATFDAGGTVTYTVFTDNNCSSAVLNSSSTVNVTNGVVPDSQPVTFNTPGTFFWQAAYSGDAHNDAAKSACTSEQLIVKTNPTIATTLSATTVNIGGSVHDSATLSGATADAGGTVTYSVYTDSACTLGKQDAGTKTVTNGVVPDSNSITFNNAGTFFWQAVYTGDGKNNGATSSCTSEQLVVPPNQSAIATAQNLLPNDSATITGATSTAGGTITFNLFMPSDATCSGAPALTQTVSVNGNGTYITTNKTFLASAVGTWRWQVIYSGDSNNVGSTSACGVEQFTILNG
ncbi:MAG TPA: hypothetical protein VGR57_02840 [Ktedonobacterales bacterium]|nr:hypothetical protein [Ktedonobacterales bacterium]